MNQIEVVRLSNLLSWYNVMVATNEPGRPDISNCTTIKQLMTTLQKAKDKYDERYK